MEWIRSPEEKDGYMFDFMSFHKAIDVVLVITIIQMIPMLVMAWSAVVALYGGTKKRIIPGPECMKKTNHFAVIVCAHNEETSLPYLLHSIEKQNYPKDKYHVYLMADHCTDGTAAIGQNLDFVTVYEREDGPTNGKGDVLKWGLEKIFSEDTNHEIDAIAVFDADNVAKEDFLWEMNLKLNDGNQIVQGNRLGGQPYRSIVTKWYTIYWAAYTTCFSYVREKLGLSVFLTGTGFAVDALILRQEGWHTETITEDVEFSIQNIEKGRRVAFCYDAVCYDEQPYQVGVMFNQLARWTTGGYQVLNRHFKGMISKKNPIRKVQRWDTLMLLLMGPCSWISAIISLINAWIMLWNLPLIYSLPAALFGLVGTIALYLGILFSTGFNQIRRRRIGVIPFLTFPFFLLVYMLCSVKTCFFPTKKWKTIKHEALDAPQD